MRFIAVECEGFGRLHGRFEFAPGLTVVTGPNEAGKSTLHELLYRLLYGFQAQERRRGKDGRLSPWEARRPWDAGCRYGAVALIADRAGRELRVEWDFEKHRVRVLDARTGTDLSKHFRGKGRDVVLGNFLLGLGREEFRQVCCLAQGDVDPPSGAAVKELGERLRALVESGSESGSVAAAVERLERAARERLGVDRRSRDWGPLSGGRWDRLLARERQVLAELERAETERAAVAALVLDLAELDQRRERLAASVEDERQRHLALRVAQASARLDRARALAERAAARPERPVALPSGLTERVARLVAELENAERAHQESEERARRERERGSLLETELDQRQRELAAVAPDGEPSAAGRKRVAELAARVEARRREVAEADPASAAGGTARARAERLRAAREHLRDLERSAQIAARGALFAILAALGSGLALAVAVGTAAAIAGALVAGAAAALALRRRAQVRRAIARTLGEAGVASPALLEDELVAAEAELAARERSEQLLASDEQELARCLDEHGAPAGPEPLARAHAYLRALELAERIAALRAELARVHEVTAAAERASTRCEQARSALAAALAEAGIADRDLRAAIRRFDEVREQAERDARAVELAERAGAELRALTAGRPLADLERERAALARELDEHVARWGARVAEAAQATARNAHRAEALADLERRVDEVARRLAQREAQLAELERRRHGLEREIEARERQLPDPADLRAELAAIAEECRTIELRRDAIRLAIVELRTAAAQAHREFAPRLNEALARVLPRITGGRYRRAFVAEDLAVAVEAPETGAVVSAEQLSRGTRDQIYLVERLAIARLLDEQAGGGVARGAQPRGRAPLLLDDPFDRFDALRLAAGLEQIVAEARERQIVLFAEERSHVDALCRLDPGCRVIELPAPELPGRQRAEEGEEAG
ncbi:AAA family ATPase [Thermoleophilum album]|uniref:AAA family ATPase n=1 Tax=Thermoleophilum album TaxID=29539 RepID=UPI00237C6212|nr:AAA family ATPase [Thermoleophilum album]WDT94007.1 AAA family ATPase [Thermoleophilum album]